MTQDESGEWIRFFDRLVHDLREPLRSVQSFSELLREIAHSRLGPDGDRATGEILGGAARMRILLDGVSRYAWSIEPEPQEIENKGSSLQLAFDMTAMGLDKQIAACGATVTGENLPKVGMKLERAARILENLIDNSLLFRSELPPVIEITAGQAPGDPGHWLVRVADNGIGIEPADREAVFEPFMRINGRKYPGAGLGLSVCRNLVGASGGRIWMETSPGGGCACLFTLPLVQD